MKQKNSISNIDSYSYYRLNYFGSEAVRTLLSQLLETYLEQGNCTALISLTKDDFENLSQAYNDLLIGHRHPRIDSVSWRYRENDPTLKKLQKAFPAWMTADDFSK